MRLILSLFILFLFGFSPQKKDIQLYKIKSTQMIALIQDFIERGRGTQADSMSEYLILSLSYTDSLSHFYLRHGCGFDLRTIYSSPVMMCVPIMGKKIIFRNNMIMNFIKGSRENACEVYRYDKPEVYAAYKAQYIRDEKEREEFVKIYGDEEELFIDDDIPTLRTRELYFSLDKQGRLRDSSYMSYDYTRYVD